MEKTIEELRAEADALGITYNPTIGAVKLAEKIEQHYKNLSAGDSVKVKEETVEEVKDTVSKGKELTAEQKLRERVGQAKVAAMKTKIVTISSNDKRDSEWTTTAYLSMENQHFGISRIVPLDIPVELELCLIEVAKTTMITLHKDEIINGKRTGNKVPTRTRKYNISYEDIAK